MEVDNYRVAKSCNVLSKLCCLCLVGILVFSIIKMNNKPVIQTGVNCSLPSHPTFGWWTIMYPTLKFSTTLSVPHGTVLNIACNSSFKLDGCSMSVCINGQWIPKIGVCLKTCPAMKSTQSRKIICSYNNRNMKNCIDALENTTAHIKCAAFYEDERCAQMRHKAVCLDGNWSENIPQCIPKCGQKVVKHKPTLIINGNDAVQGEFPWSVAIYKLTDQVKKILICGGTLLNERVVLTAAHCMVDLSGKPESKEIFEVAAGKYYRNYKDKLDENVQYSLIEDFFIHEEYRGQAEHYKADIAIIVVKKNLKFSSTVLPICIDWDKKFLFDRSTDFLTGYVSGWGYNTINGTYPNVLQALNVSIISRKKCEDIVSKKASDYKDFITSDKICAGFVNEGKSPCNGDSGGGLVVHHEGRYYILGVVSTAPQKQDSVLPICDDNNVSFYTLVYKYIDDFIEKYYVRFKPQRDQDEDKFSFDTPSVIKSTESPQQKYKTRKTLPPIKILNSSCIIPKNPNFGNFDLMLPKSEIYKMGMSVPSKSVLMLKCDVGYKVEDGMMTMVCDNGKWSPSVLKCLRTCPSMMSNRTMNISCIYNNKETENCIEPVDGTKIRPNCAPYYHLGSHMEHPIFCLNGTWTPGIPECVPMCGRTLVRDPALSKNVGKEKEFPWIVGIYRNKTLLCSGNLINERIVLTARKCLAKTKTRFLNVGYYIKATEDLEFSNISEIFTENDIAVIVLEERIVFSLNIQPVCVDWEGNVENEEAYVYWWNNSSKSRSFIQKATFASSQECTDCVMKTSVESICVLYKENVTRSVFYGGGGLVVKQHNKYHIVGVMVDVEYKCADDNYGLFAKIDDGVKMRIRKLLP